MIGTAQGTDARSAAGQLLRDYFHCPENVGDFAVASSLSCHSGYFRLGPDAICYGQCSSGVPAKLVTDPLHDARPHVAVSGSVVRIPFDPAQVVENLRCERYLTNSRDARKTFPAKSILRSAYYLVRPIMPIAVRKRLQKMHLRRRKRPFFPSWPVDRTVDNILEQILVYSMRARKVEKIPFIWFWPEGARCCAMLTHDVETSSGVEFCPQLMDLNDSFGIKTSFQIVPEKRYPVLERFLESIRKRGFEINIHDVNHDGRLFSDHTEFLRRARRINSYAKQFGALGFRSAVLYRNVDWFDALNFSYDMSIPNVAHLDPQLGGCCTVLPFFIGKILELPLTATQDYSLFHILNDYSIELWKEQISLIREKHGLISFIIHPDYLTTEATRSVYVELLEHLSELRAQGKTWIALPGEVAAWWRMRNEMNLVKVGDSWRIEGKGSERARLAYATIASDRLTYEVAHPSLNSMAGGR